MGCELAMNGGFFNLITSDCLGNVISNGNPIQISGIENANFGILKVPFHIFIFQ